MNPAQPVTSARISQAVHGLGLLEVIVLPRNTHSARASRHLGVRRGEHRDHPRCALSDAKVAGSASTSSLARSPMPTSRAPTIPVIARAWTAHSIEVRGGAPLASKPTSAPANTSPEPAVARAGVPLRSTYIAAPGAVIHVSAPRSATGVPNASTASRSDVPGASDTDRSSRPSNLAISLGLGTRTTSARDARMTPGCEVTTASAAASSTMVVPGVALQSRSRTRSVMVSGSTVPEPRSTASYWFTSSQRSAVAVLSMEPVSVSTSGTTRASGTATESAALLDSTVARQSRPAPVRSDARPASSTPPGVSRVPPITSTDPRPFLSASAAAGGSGCRPRNAWSVGTVSGSAARNAHIRFGVDGCPRLPQWRRVVVPLERHSGRPVPCLDVAGDGGVGENLSGGDGEKVLFCQSLEDVPEHEDHDLVRRDEHTLVFVLSSDAVEHAPNPERDIAPTLATGGAVIELADARSGAGFFRKPLLDAAAREP